MTSNLRITGLGPIEAAVLLAVQRLSGGAYAVTVRLDVNKRLNQAYSYGAIHETLARLEKKGLVGSRTGAASPVRGGKSKRFYFIEPPGIAALDAGRVLAEGPDSDTIAVVRQRLADGRTIADVDVHRLVAEIDRLRAVIRSIGGST